MSKGKKIIIILGPNASGKSNLGVSLAKQLRGEIISADSRQIYKNLNIGSGKITKKEMMGIPHHCLDIANPKKVFTAYDYKQCAEKAMQKIWQKNKIPIIVGGTGFYIDAAVGRVVLSNVPPDPKLRKKLQKLSTIQLFMMLKKLDPKKAKNIDKNNRVRLVRAIEVLKGKLLVFSKTQGIRPKQILWLGIKRSKKDLKKRIHHRLLLRLNGIIKEIKKLRKNGISWKRLFDLGLEYRYVSLYIRKKDAAPQSGASLASLRREMIKKLENEINQYAKRQMTYFKRNKEIHWINSEKELKNLVPTFIGTKIGRRSAS